MFKIDCSERLAFRFEGRILDSRLALLHRFKQPTSLAVIPCLLFQGPNDIEIEILLETDRAYTPD